MKIKIALTLILMALGAAYAADATPAPVVEAVPVVAVMPFTNLAPDPEFVTPVPPNKASDLAAVAFNTTNWVSYGLPEFVLMGLTRAGSVGVIQSYVLNIATKKLDKEYGTTLDLETIGKLDDLVGTNWMVEGEYHKDKDDLIVSVKLINPDDAAASKGPFEFKIKAGEFLTLSEQITEKLLTEMGKTPDAEALERIKQHPSENFLAIRWMGEGCRTYATGQRISNFQLALEADPAFTEARLLLADSYRLDGQETRALPEYETVIKEDPSLPGGVWGKAIAIKTNLQDEITKVRKEYDDRIAKSTDAKNTGKLKDEQTAAINKIYSDSFPEVIRLLEDNIKAFPLFIPNYEDIVRLNTDMGFKLKILSFFDKAIEYASAATKLFPEYYLSYELEGQAYWYRGMCGKSWQSDYKTAIDVFKDCLKWNGNNPRIHYNLGSLYYNLKMGTEAVAEWETFLTQEPNFNKKDELQKMIDDIKTKGLK
jgi:tetratricopeptide (TPR) repeat protein